MPYYAPSQNELNPAPVIDKYIEYCEAAGVSAAGRNILEIGTGATNSTGYEITARLRCSYWGYEPFEKFNEKLDCAMFNCVKTRYPDAEKGRVIRTTTLDTMPEKSIDVIFSNSVLEHVTDTNALIAGLKRVLKPGGRMLHAVDYRDHFFKYPFHFLQFSRRTWDRWLNPGDLPRHRISDHMELFRKNGFSVEVIQKKNDYPAFTAIKKKIHPEFAGYTDEDLASTIGVIFVKG
ncbi:MAG: methyltransferase domain-containing protein [Planctomycetes bacterium]|nr:methyltransferase domain-containing protein [Planctomycetota bacterium]